MTRLFRFSSVLTRDPAVATWLSERPGELGHIARHWFQVLRDCGGDVHELLHDGHPTACVGDAAFAYVNVFTAHVNVGLFNGAELEDPAGLLAGTGKFMRHVKLRPGEAVDETALEQLIRAAYAGMRDRLIEESNSGTTPPC